MSEFVDLSVDIHPEMDRMSFLPCPTVSRLSEQSETSLQVSAVSMPVHLGTHVDAPCHAIADGESVESVPVERWIRPGTVVNVDVEPRGEITRSQVAGAGDRLDPGDALIVRTGWLEEYGGTDTYADHPYFSQGVADWLVDQELSMVGMDFLTPDMPPELRSDEFTYPIHTTLLEAGVLIVENLANTGQLPARFRFGAPPIRIRGADGAPVRAFAELPDT